MQPCSVNILDLDQVQCFVLPDLGSNCMERSAADDFLPLADSWPYMGIFCPEKDVCLLQLCCLYIQVYFSLDLMEAWP